MIKIYVMLAISVDQEHQNQMVVILYVQLVSTVIVELEFLRSV